MSGIEAIVLWTETSWCSARHLGLPGGAWHPKALTFFLWLPYNFSFSNHQHGVSNDPSTCGHKTSLAKICDDEAMQPTAYNKYFTDNIQKARHDSVKAELKAWPSRPWP